MKWARNTAGRCMAAVEALEAGAASGMVDYADLLARLDSPLIVRSENAWHDVNRIAGLRPSLNAYERTVVMSTLRARAGVFGRIAKRVTSNGDSAPIRPQPADPFTGLPRE